MSMKSALNRIVVETGVAARFLAKTDHSIDPELKRYVRNFIDTVHDLAQDGLANPLEQEELPL